MCSNLAEVRWPLGPMIYVMYTELHIYMGGAPNQPKSPSIRLPTPPPPPPNFYSLPTKSKSSPLSH